MHFSEGWGFSGTAHEGAPAVQPRSWEEFGSAGLAPAGPWAVRWARQGAPKSPGASYLLRIGDGKCPPLALRDISTGSERDSAHSLRLLLQILARKRHAMADCYQSSVKNRTHAGAASRLAQGPPMQRPRRLPRAVCGRVQPWPPSTAQQAAAGEQRQWAPPAADRPCPAVRESCGQKIPDGNKSVRARWSRKRTRFRSLGRMQR